MQGRGLEVAQADTVETDLAGVRVDQAHGEPHHGGLARAGGANEGDGLAGLGGEGHLSQPRRAGVVAEFHGVERQPPAPAIARRQAHGAGRIDDGGNFIPQLEHLFHVDEGLTDFAVGEAEEIERDEQVGENLNGRCYITRTQPAVRGLDAGHDRDDGKADGHDDRLQAVQQDHRGVGFDRRAGVVGERILVGGGRAWFGAEGFDGLVVDQGVDGRARGPGLGLVHLAAMGDSPVRDGEGHDRIEAHGGQGRGREPPVEVGGQNDGRQDQFNGGGAEVEDETAQEEVHRPGAAVDDPGERAGLFGLVKVDRQGKGVGKGLSCGARLGRLADRHEHQIAQARRQGRDQPKTAPGQDEAGKGDGGLFGRPSALGEHVDGVADDERRPDAQRLARQDEPKGRGHANLELGGL